VHVCPPRKPRAQKQLSRTLEERPTIGCTHSAPPSRSRRIDLSTDHHAVRLLQVACTARRTLGGTGVRMAQGRGSAGRGSDGRGGACLLALTLFTMVAGAGANPSKGPTIIYYSIRQVRNALPVLAARLRWLCTHLPRMLLPESFRPATHVDLRLPCTQRARSHATPSTHPAPRSLRQPDAVPIALPAVASPLERHMELVHGAMLPLQSARTWAHNCRRTRPAVPFLGTPMLARTPPGAGSLVRCTARGARA
jgi:hypothetical protein